MANLRIWTDDKIQYLRDNYPSGDTDEIAFVLGHSREQVRAAAYSLGIKKSKESLRAIRLNSLLLGKTMNEKVKLPKGTIHRRIPSGDITIIGRVLTHRAL